MTVLTHFETLGRAGVGNSSNTIAQSMAYFDGCLYVGGSNPQISTAETGPRILRYRFDTAQWETVYTPPLVRADKRVLSRDIQLAQGSLGSFKGKPDIIGTLVPRDYGYRSMTVFKGASDRKPCLYVSSLSIWGSVLLRSTDGVNFETISEPGFGNNTILSFRGLRGFRGKLFVSPAGTVTDQFLDRNLAPQTTIYASDDPARGKWSLAAEPAFGDLENRTVYSLCVALDRLYAGTGNPERGFQVWSTSAEGRPPYVWKQVIRDGAFRYNLNLAACAMVEFKGALYVGGGITGFGYDTVHDVGPSAAELIRIDRDNRWELIVGTPRVTPEGLKVPLSGMGPGFDDPYNSAVWRMVVHDDVLYVGTHQWEPYARARNGRNDEIKGGFQVWASEDGENWTRVVTDGFGNFGSFGSSSMQSTPYGLFVGTANHTQLLRLVASAKGRNVPGTASRGFDVLLGRSLGVI
jgi:hypothetical protein